MILPQYVVSKNILGPITGNESITLERKNARFEQLASKAERPWPLPNRQSARSNRQTVGRDHTF